MFFLDALVMVYVCIASVAALAFIRLSWIEMLRATREEQERRRKLFEEERARIERVRRQMLLEAHEMSDRRRGT